jgi:hypothetical protein
MDTGFITVIVINHPYISSMCRKQKVNQKIRGKLDVYRAANQILVNQNIIHLSFQLSALWKYCFTTDTNDCFVNKKGLTIQNHCRW